MIYRFDDWELDTELFELRRDGAARHTEPQVFDLLNFLVSNRDRVVTRDEIVAAVWGGRIVSEATISTCLRGARAAIEDDGRTQRLIRTVHGRGVRFVGSVVESDPTAPADVEESPGGQATPQNDGATALEAADAATRRLFSTTLPVLAVLPFGNLSQAVDEYFADGLTEDIIASLSRFRGLLVIGRTSAFQFKGHGASLPELRDALGADYIVEGSVRRAGQRVRIAAHLIDAATGVQLWGDSYDRDIEDIFAVQDEATRTIAATLDVKMQDVRLQRALRKSAAELDAYDCVLRARGYTATLSAESHAESRDLLEKAVALDPANADARALLANVYLAEHRFEANPRPDPIGRALAMAETATQLDPQNAYARCWLAIVHFFRGENDRFRSEADRAVALNPNDPETLADIGHYYAFMGAFERGVALSRQARRLNPLHPTWYYFSDARLHYDRRDYEAVLADVERIGLPHFYWVHLLKAAARGQLGRPDARDALNEIFACKPDFDARAELTKWNAAPPDHEHLLEGLHKAGLPR